MRRPGAGLAFHSQASGYLQRVDMDALQRIAAERKLRITLTVAPGALIVCSRPIGYGLPDGEALTRSAAASTSRRIWRNCAAGMPITGDRHACRVRRRRQERPCHASRLARS